MKICLCGVILNLKAFCFGAIPDFPTVFFWAEYRPQSQCEKRFPPNFMGENSQYRGGKIIRKNWLKNFFKWHFHAYDLISICFD